MEAPVIRHRRSEDDEAELATLSHGRFLDLLFGCLTLILLFGFGARQGADTFSNSEITTACGKADNLRKSVLFYYSLYGEWPRDRKAIEMDPDASIFLNPSHPADSNIEIEDGAIHVPLEHDPSVFVSLRPAISRHDPEGSVVWVLSDRFNPEIWQAFGADRSTLVSKEIPQRYFLD